MPTCLLSVTLRIIRFDRVSSRMIRPRLLLNPSELVFVAVVSKFIQYNIHYLVTPVSTSTIFSEFLTIQLRQEVILINCLYPVFQPMHVNAFSATASLGTCGTVCRLTPILPT